MDHVECIFCKKSLPAKLDAGFEKHMEHHKAGFNLEFLFTSMLLDPLGMEKTIEFMLSLNTSKDKARKKELSSCFGKTEVKEEHLDVKDNIIDDESYEKFTISTSTNKNEAGSANEERVMKSSDERNLERLIMIQDDNHSVVDHPLEETSFPAAAVTEQEDKTSADRGVVITPGTVEIPKRKRGRPRKYPVESPQATTPTKSVKKEQSKDRFRCSCNIKFKSSSSMRRHMDKYHGLHACQLCSLTFKTEQELQRHMEDPRDRHDPDYMSTVCYICGAQFKQYRFLKDHKKSVHEIGEKKKCDLCPEFVTNLKKHLRKCHTELKVCEICQKPMKCLENHMLTMHGTEEDKKFRCEECGKGFILRDKLVAHKVIHSTEKPFVCRFNCGYSSKTAGNRRKHEEGVHQKKPVLELKHGNIEARRTRRQWRSQEEEQEAMENIEAVEKIEEAQKDHGGMEMDQNVNKKDFDAEGQNGGVEVMSDEEDIDLDDLEEVEVGNGQTARDPERVEIQDYPAPGPGQLMQVNLPLSEIITSSPPVSELSDQVHQEYQEICSFFY